MRTVGVEEELLLVEAGTGRALPVASEVIARAEERGSGANAGEGVVGLLESELQQQQVESKTHPTIELSAVESELHSLRRAADDAAQEVGARLAAIAVCPTPVVPVTTPSPRYREIAERFGPIATESLTCGLHVHVRVADAEEAVGVIDRIRVWLPVLLALSANSPYVEGLDTGYGSYRSQVQHRWPSSGPSELFGSARAYEETVASMLGTGVLMDRGMVYFDARTSADHPTVELRVADICLSASEAVLVAAFARAMVETAARRWADGEPAPAVPAAVIRLAQWQAARHGLTGDLLDPRTARPAPAWEVLDGVVDELRPALRETGDEERVTDGLARLREAGTGSERQRAELERTGSMERLMDFVVRETSASGPAGT
ncbi:carboxylate-amine ligase [Georgenia sp. Z1344]|uniref:carboxylate-amine ligase n=1 Tax=Georgenia sp. Z1344 TaxID=3416706 RepID=UPI003CF4F8FE